MSICCDDTKSTQVTRTGGLTVAIAGNPNCGKTTIFNALTGLRQKVANYPGVTVEKKTGRCRIEYKRSEQAVAYQQPNGVWANIIDLPGTYSLISRSPDETVAMEVLRGLRADTPAPDVVIVVVDASNLQRNLYLVSQLVELGRPMVVALNMMDIAQRRGLRISPDRLSTQLGVPVVPVVGHKREGIDELKQAVLQAKIAPMPAWELPFAMEEALQAVSAGLATIDGESLHDRHAAIAERLLIGDRAPDMAKIASKQPVSALLDSAQSRLSQMGIDPMQADIEAHYRWIEGVAVGSLIPACESLIPMEPGIVGEQTIKLDGPAEAHEQSDARITGQTIPYAQPGTYVSEKVDRIFLHWFWGFACFGAIMATLFVSIFWLADPLMGAMEAGVAWLGDFVTPIMPEGPLQDLWTDGIVAGVGGVVVFIPQIAILFLFLAILEDSGYLARAAFLMDRLLSKVGLNGKSFIPLLSSFACAIPGIMAARTIENRRERLATIFVAPFMSCSARLPVYGLLIGAFFGAYSSMVQGGILLTMYLTGIVAAAATAWFFKLGGDKGAPSSFILELPTYKVPQVSQVLRVVYTNTKAFVMKAGTIIFCLSVILWAMMYYPRLPEGRIAEIDASIKAPITTVAGPQATAEQQATLNEYEESIRKEAVEKAVGGEQLRHSIAGRFGHFIEPVIRPLGYDWKMGVGLVGAFAAREVFVSTMGIVYSVGEVEDDTAGLEEQMAADRYADGRPVWTPLVAVSLLVWFVLAMQCISTLAIVRRETASWRWPVLQLVYMNALAWIVCFAIYRVGRIWLV